MVLAGMRGTPTIRVRINSPGGDVFDGIAIYNALRACGSRIEVTIDGIAASIASVIAMAGNDIAMARGSLLMIHKPWACAMGEADDLRKTADLLDKIDGQLVEIYVARSKLTTEEVAAALAAETYYTPAEAVAAGLADRMSDEVAPADIAALAQTLPRLAALKRELPRLAAQLNPPAPPAADPATSPETTPEKPMNLPLAIVAVLALTATATETEAVDAINKTKTEAKDAGARAATAEARAAALEGAIGKTGEEALGHLKALQVKAGAHDAAVAKVSELSAQIEKRDRDALVAQGKADGKLVPAMMAWAETQTIESLTAFLASAPVVVKLEGGHRQPAKNLTGPDTVNVEKFKAMTPMEKHNLKNSDPDTYEALRAAAEKK